MEWKTNRTTSFIAQREWETIHKVMYSTLYTSNLIEDLDIWLYDNIIGNWAWPSINEIWFESEDDALLFKLRWG